MEPPYVPPIFGGPSLFGLDPDPVKRALPQNPSVPYTIQSYPTRQTQVSLARLQMDMPSHP